MVSGTQKQIADSLYTNVVAAVVVGLTTTVFAFLEGFLLGAGIHVARGSILNVGALICALMAIFLIVLLARIVRISSDEMSGFVIGEAEQASARTLAACSDA